MSEQTKVPSLREALEQARPALCELRNNAKANGTEHRDINERIAVIDAALSAPDPADELARLRDSNIFLQRALISVEALKVLSNYKATHPQWAFPDVEKFALDAITRHQQAEKGKA